MSRNPEPPMLPAYGWQFDVGPCPLSPAWPKVVVKEPEDEFEALHDELVALRRLCAKSLNPELSSCPYMLGLGERARLNAVLKRLKAANEKLPHHHRLVGPADWNEPALPENVLFGVREVLPLLDTAASVASSVSTLRRRPLYAAELADA